MTLLFSKERSVLSYYFWMSLYAVNYHVIRLKAAEHFFWHMVKLELFYIGGACQNSGYCCQNMQLVINGNSLDSLSAFDVYKKKKTQ